MIGLDTNVLVRLFAEDDPRQLQAAIALVDSLSGDRKAVVNIVVVVELVWVLRRAYKFDGDRISTVLRRLSEHPQIVLPDLDVIRDAAHRALGEGGDVADHIIALLNRSHGCTTTYTFDDLAARHPDFSLVP